MRRPGRKTPLSEFESADLKHCYAYAVALLARRDYATVELRKKLEERGYVAHPIEAALLNLEQTRSLDDRRYGENVVAYRARRGQGPARIRNELRRAGVSADLVDAAVKTGEDAPDFLRLAREARARKFGAEIPTDRKERARQARFLQYRGFSTDHIRAVLDGSVEDAETDSESDT